jgi:hypothetical protein
MGMKEAPYFSMGYGQILANIESAQIISDASQPIDLTEIPSPRHSHSIVNPVAGALWRRHVGPATHRRYRQRYRNSSPALNGSLRSAPENARLLCFKSLRGSVHQHNFASAIPPLIPSGAFEYAPTYCLSAALDDNTNASKLPREYHQPTAHLATHPRCRGPIGPRD